MFEEYLQDAYEFLLVAEKRSKDSNPRESRRYYRASVFYASGAMEAFINYIADSFEKAKSLTPHETSFLNDKALVFSVEKGLYEKNAFHKLDDKIRFLIRRFSQSFDFKSVTWVKFMEFKDFRDSLVHPRQIEDETSIADYHKKVRTGLKAIIEVMDVISTGTFQKPLRRQLLDLIPE